MDPIEHATPRSTTLAELARLRLALADGQGGAAVQPPGPRSRRAPRSSRASSATRIRSSRPSRTRSWPATTSSSSASAARPRPGWRGCSSALLDPWLPVVAGGELNDDPSAPISPAARAIVEREGDATPIDWIPRDRRYAEKLATPDITIADLIGEVDPIKVAEGRYLSDELTLHYGLIPRANRGIVAINELPDLAERIQVGLLNILEERDVQIRGFVVRLPLDLYMVASANPEDYTSRGRIITPLKDRLGSQIRTHYPRTLEHEMAIVRQEKHRFEAEEGTPAVVVPAFMEELVAELTHLARRSPEISQRSGVSVRVSVANAEVLEAAALKRAVRLGEPVGAPRVSDLGRGRRLDRRQGRARDRGRRVARGPDRRAAHHQGAPHDVLAARLDRRARWRRRGVRGRVHGRDRRPDAVA